MIVFIYNKIVTGGVHTLLLRLSKQLIDRGYSSSVYCFDIDPNLMEQYSALNVPLNKVQFDDFLNSIKLSEDEIQAVIVFEFNLYLKLIKSFHLLHNQINIFLYSVHPYTFDYYFYGISLKKKLIHKLFEKSYSRFIDDEVKNGHIIFMDEQSLIHTVGEYNIHLDNDDYDKYILRIMLDDSFYKGYGCSGQSSGRIENFLTVSRADFPFKGYIKGLIEIFSELKTKFNIHLTIISSGPDIDTLKKWIESCDSKEFINLETDVPYYELGKYYLNSDVYIGMGTTVIEAAKCGLISFPVEPYTYECRTKGIFNEDARWLLTELGEGTDIKHYLYELFDFDDCEIIRIKNEAPNSVDRLYSPNIIIDKLINVIRVAKTVDQYRYYPKVYMALRYLREKI